MAKSPYLECGKIINTHGVRGAVKVENRCDTPSVLASLKRVYLERGGVYEENKVISSSVMGANVLMTLEGIGDIDKAMLLKNRLVYAAREDIPLPEGSYFIADLYGLQVIDADSGRVYGTLSEVINRGASDIYVVKTPKGERMMPAVDEFVKKTDPDEGIFVKPIPGMLYDEEEDI
ncbi:MAG: ribosome maturation factor RimM [Clostridia bacterium]|nr:ribosome maturation factor RimM [Clostridia bacterium]